MQDHQVVNVFKGLVIDAVDKAQSGHPGGPMSSMDLAYLLFSEFLRFDPDDPRWLGRDRFILSAGHMSMLQYAMLHGIGWLAMEDLERFRQLHSRTPGHPENGATPGVECTTGPLGQGAAMSVGFAIASRHLAAVLDEELFGYRTWALVSDGDLQEGVAMASASLAGHLKLSNLVWVYDKNRVQLSGPTSKCMSDDFAAVYGGLGWRVITIDGHDHAEIRRAYDQVLAGSDRPTLIVAHTVIGNGCASLEDSYKTHGAPLPAEERVKTKAKLGLPAGADFYCPDEALARFRRGFEKRRAEARAWRERLDARFASEPGFKQAFAARFDAVDVGALSRVEWATDKPLPTRNAFGDVIKQWAHEIPGLIGGSADLAPSNMTAEFAKEVGDFDAESHRGRNLNFGVREFPMSAITNGIALHGGLIPFDATFLAFADYSRGALRLGAIQRARVIHELTHDSFQVGEDGPTHQPVEQVMALRAIPDLYVMRPADPVETEVLLRRAIALPGPSALCLSRQKLPFLPLPRAVVEQAARGAYVVRDADRPDLVIIATGSEVVLALEVAEKLAGRTVRVVSMPCWELFEAEPETYRQAVLPDDVTSRVTIEAGITLGWARYAGRRGLAIGLDHFGASAPADVLAREYGFTADRICERISRHTFA